MKRLHQRGIGLLLALLLALSVLPSAMALEGTSFPGEPEVILREGDGESGYSLRETRNGLGGSVSGATAAQTFSAPPLASQYDNGTFYSQLSARQKSCYEALEKITIDRILKAAEVSGYRQLRMRVNELYGLSLSGSIEDSVFKVGSTSQSLENQMYTDLFAAIVAMRYDYPDRLWLEDMRYGYGWQKENDSVVKVTDVLFMFKLEYGGQEKKMWESMRGEAQKIAAEADKASDTYSKVLAVHDTLAERSTYNSDPVGSMDETLSHSAYSALIGGDAYEPVCDGYAKAFKLVCDFLEIPCVTASSTTHMWNNVKMDDGEWYIVDLTWDDMDDKELSHAYFLLGSQSQVKGEIISKEEQHVEENPYRPESGLWKMTLKFPTKNKEAYKYLGKDHTALRYPDVKRTAWYYEYVEASSELGLFKGNKEGLFQPGNKITRAEFVQVMANAAGVDLSSYKTTKFRDVKADQWFLPAVAWAESIGLMQGYNGLFRPNAAISREEMCVVLANALENSAKPGSFKFPDDKSIASWAKDAVYTCYALGLVQGDNRGNFAPRSSTLRSEAATVFTRYAEQGGELPKPPAPDNNEENNGSENGEENGSEGGENGENGGGNGGEDEGIDPVNPNPVDDGGIDPISPGIEY